MMHPGGVVGCLGEEDEVAWRERVESKDGGDADAAEVFGVVPLPGRGVGGAAYSGLGEGVAGEAGAVESFDSAAVFSSG